VAARPGYVTIIHITGAAMFAVIHFLHVASALLWAGGTLTLALIIAPTLARLPAEQAARFWAAMDPVASPLIGGAGFAVLILGPLRAWWGGGVTSLADLLSPYGLCVLAALALFVALEGFGGPFRARFPRLMADPTAYAASAPAMARRHAIATTLLMTLLIADMVIMGLGLY
jgi:putative copper export protein